MFLLFLQHFLSSNKNLVHQLGSISSTTLATSSVVFCIFFWTCKRNTAPPKVGGTSIILFLKLSVQSRKIGKQNLSLTSTYTCVQPLSCNKMFTHIHKDLLLSAKNTKKQAFPPHGPRILGHPNLLGSVDCGGAGSPFQGNSGIST